MSKARLDREKKTISHMMEIYCRGRHSGGHPCSGCRQLLDYAMQRIDGCPYGGAKPSCAKCPVQCYNPVMGERIRQVMRYSGPRMMMYHPVLAIRHFLDEMAGRRKSR